LAIHKFTSLIEAGKPVPIFGDGSTGRDYTFIDDIVAGVLAATEYDPPSTQGTASFEAINLGNSHPVQLSQLVDLLERATGKRAIRYQKPPQPGDVPLTWADVSKAGRLLGYRPATGLEQGLKKFVAWYRAADPKRRA
jgi:UDP-glucuronate 4-epimerase